MEGADVEKLLAVARAVAGPDPDPGQLERAASALPFVTGASASFGGEAGVDYLELRLSDEAGMTVADLEGSLGEAKSVPRLHPGDPEQVAFGLDDPDLPFTSRLYADLGDDGRVRAITLRRDPRI